MKCKCGSEFQPFKRNGIILSKLCTSCLIAKVKQKQNKDWKQEKKAIKERLKTHSEWMNELQKLINRIARLIDYGQPCIARPNLKNENGGHFKSVGGHSNIRFNLHNIHGQSIHSNKWKSGEEGLFRLGLIRVYGLIYCEYVESLNMEYLSIKLSIDDIKEKLPICREIIRALEANQFVRSATERMRLRDYYNEIIGIYKK